MGVVEQSRPGIPSRRRAHALAAETVQRDDNLVALIQQT